MKIQELGRALFERAGMSPADPPRGGAVAIAEAIYGRHCVKRQPRALAEGSISIVKSEPRIYVRADLSLKRVNFAVARVLARGELAKAGVFRDERQECLLAGYLVAPDEAFMPLFVEHGYDLTYLSDRWVVTETCIALRSFEAANSDGVVVTPGRVYRRGRGLVWAGDDEARSLARSRSARSVRSVRIRDEPQRAALVPRRG